MMLAESTKLRDFLVNVTFRRALRTPNTRRKIIEITRGLCVKQATRYHRSYAISQLLRQSAWPPCSLKPVLQVLFYEDDPHSSSKFVGLRDQR